MTLEQAYSANVGKSIPSPDGDPRDAGQCVSWASYVLKNVYNHPYVYANAIDWWQNPELADAFDFVPFGAGNFPKQGDFVVWGTRVGSKFGHIDVCAQDGDALYFMGYDSNWGDIPRLTTIKHNYAYGILGYIRKKGDDMFKGRTAEQWAEIATKNQVALDAANAKLAELKAQPVPSGLDPAMEAEIANTNMVVNKILSILQKIFIGSK